MANRFMAYLGPVMKWGVQELDAFEHNFHGDIRKGRERRRQRVLTNAELKAVWNATFALEAEAGEGNAISRAKSGAARSCRRLVPVFDANAAAARWRVLAWKGGDIIDSQWRFITKGNKPHRLKLPQLALDQTGAADARDLCFPGQRGSKITGWSKLKNKLDELSSVNGWVLHDLRRTGSTRLEEIGHDDWCTSYSTIRDRDCHPSTCTPTCLTGWARPWASGPARSSASPVPAAPFRKVS